MNSAKIIRSLTLFCIVGLASTLAISSLAQPFSPPPPPNVTPNPLSVKASVVAPPDSVFHAPATITLWAEPSARTLSHSGDSVLVEFYAGDNEVGSKKSAWQNGPHTNTDSHTGQNVLVPHPGFQSVTLDWTNATAGTYVVTAKVTDSKGHAATSARVKVRVEEN
jgi:hypothetical protein